MLQNGACRRVLACWFSLRRVAQTLSELGACSLYIVTQLLIDDSNTVTFSAAVTQVEARLRQLEGRSLASDAGKARGKAQPAPYEAAKQVAGGSGLAPGAAKAYNADADVVEPVKVSSNLRFSWFVVVCLGRRVYSSVRGFLGMCWMCFCCAAQTMKACHALLVAETLMI
jgi:hypothetical protein